MLRLDVGCVWAGCFEYSTHFAAFHPAHDHARFGVCVFSFPL